MTKLNHTPSKKAGQLSRHSCNQIPRGRYQQTKYRAGPGHQTRQPAGEGKAKRTEKGAKNKRGQTTTGPVGPTHAQRGAQQIQEDQETHKQEPNTKRSHKPRRATQDHQRDSRLPKLCKTCTSLPIHRTNHGVKVVLRTGSERIGIRMISPRRKVFVPQYPLTTSTPIFFFLRLGRFALGTVLTIE